MPSRVIRLIPPRLAALRRVEKRRARRNRLPESPTSVPAIQASLPRSSRRRSGRRSHLRASLRGSLRSRSRAGSPDRVRPRPSPTRTRPRWGTMGATRNRGPRVRASGRAAAIRSGSPRSLQVAQASAGVAAPTSRDSSNPFCSWVSRLRRTLHRPRATRASFLSVPAARRRARTPSATRASLPRAIPRRCLRIRRAATLGPAHGPSTAQTATASAAKRRAAPIARRARAVRRDRRGSGSSDRGSTAVGELGVRRGVDDLQIEVALPRTA